jgi:acyl-CoA dehydrogenase
MRELFETTIDRLLADHVDPALIGAAEAGEWPAKLWAAVEETGLALATAPEEHGGAGATWGEAFVLVRAAGRHGAPIPLAEALLANWLLAQAGLDPVEGPVTIAEGGGLSLRGETASGVLAAVPWGRAVGHVVTVSGVAEPRVVLLATRDATAVQAQNTAREPRDDLDFNNAKVVAQASLPAHLPADIVRLGGAMLRSAQIAGALERLLEMSVQYANERVQFGQRIGKFQAVQHQIAVLSEHAASAMAAADAAFSAEGPGLSAFQIAAAKICTSEAAGAGATIAHAVHGAIGFTYEHSLHFATRRLWSWRSEFGSQAAWAERLGREACAAGSTGLWPAVTAGGYERAAS